MPGAVLVNPADHSERITTLLDSADGYQTDFARQMDISFQALQKGIIPDSTYERIQIQEATVTHLADNYRFIKKYFGSLRSLYILILRLLMLNNPLKEIYAYFSVRSQPTLKLYSRHIHYPDFFTFDSQLLNEKPLVSIVIPTLNRYEYLKDVLSDLENQTYNNFEVLVCDQSEPLEKSFYSGWKLNLTLIPQKEKALWLARNRCIMAARGDYILLFDDDSRVEPDWIEQHIRCLDFFKSSISAGVTHTIVGHGLSPKETYFHLSDVFDTGNAMVKRVVFDKIGLFDRQFEKQRMGDGEFGLRASLGGFLSISNPYAKRIHLKVESGGLREMGSWDELRPKKILGPRPIPSVLYFIKNYFGWGSVFYYLLLVFPFIFIPYNKKGDKKSKILFLGIAIILFPIAIISYLKSIKKCLKMIKSGPKIMHLD